MNPGPLDYSHLALLLLLQAPLVTIPGQFKSGTSTSTKLGDTPTGQSKCAGWKRTQLAWCTYETDETNVVPKSSADLVPFTQQNIANLKLDQLKSRKLQKDIAAAKASM